MAATTPRPAGAATVAGHAVDRSTLPLLLTLGLGVFAGALDLGVLGPALPALGATFGVGPRALAWVFTLYLLANVVAIPVWTTLADRLGRRPIYIACVATFAAGSALAIAAPSYAVFLVARAVQAIGAGGIFPVATAAIADRVPPERRGAALGLVAATWGLAAIVGPNVGGIVTHVFSWHAIFAANVPLAAVVIVLARRHVPATAAHARGPLDLAGVITLGIGLLATMAGLTRLDVTGTNVHGNAATIAEIACALAAFAAFAAIERTAPEPIVPPALFRDRQLVVTYALEILIGMLEGALFFIPAALVAAQHLTAAAAGGIAALGAFTFVAVIPGSGRALDRIGSRSVLAAGTVFTTAGLALFAAGMSSLWLSLGAMVVAGIGFGSLLGAPTRYIVTNHVVPQRRATAVGLLSVFLIVGQILGGSLAGGLAGTGSDDVAGYRLAYAAFAALGVAALALTFALDARTRERTAPPVA